MRILITGYTSGLGKALSGALAAEGARIIYFGRDLADFSNTSDVTAEIRRRTVNDEQPCSDPLAAIIHCAGAEVVAPLRLTSDEQYRKAMMCADSAFAILRAAASKGVMADGGSIVLMSSVAAHRGSAGMVAYSAGKAAIEGMVRAAAVELAPRRIRVNAVAAGAFRSPMHDRITARMPQPSQDAYAASHPLGFGSVETVARAVLGLLEEPWITGTVRVVDGGYLAG